MKTLSLPPRASRAGANVLLMVLVISAVLGFLVIAYMRLLVSQNSFSVRSQVWNSCLPLVEAGIEEALAQLNKQANTNFADSGWTGSSTSFTKVKGMDNGYYSVNVICTNIWAPVITSTGYLPTPVTVAAASGDSMIAAAFVPDSRIKYISRTVRAVVQKLPLLPKALVAKSYVDFNGNNIMVDSYNSSNGMYNAASARDKGNVTMNGDILNPGNIGNAKIKGVLTVGPTATFRIGPNGSVGDVAWVNAGTRGIETDWLRRDANITFPDVLPPWSGGAVAPGNAGNGYKYVFDGGNFECPSLNVASDEKLWIQSDSVLWVRGNISIAGGIKVSSGAKLLIYASGPDCSLSGTYDKSDIPSEFRVYGLPTLKNIDANGFAASIYAPSANLRLNGGAQFYGGSVTDTVTLLGNTAYHYDEALSTLDNRNYVVTSWNEL